MSARSFVAIKTTTPHPAADGNTSALSLATSSGKKEKYLKIQKVRHSYAQRKGKRLQVHFVIHCEGDRYSFYPTENLHHSPHAFLISKRKLTQARKMGLPGGEELWGVFHSHPLSPASLSPVDHRNAFKTLWRGLGWIICSLRYKKVAIYHWRAGTLSKFSEHLI